MAFESYPIRFRLQVLVLGFVTVLALTLAGCQSKTSDTGSSKKQSLVAIGNQAVENLGSENKAAFAVLAAWDKGYTVEQIVGAIGDDRLQPSGGIKDVKPEGRPQNYLRLSARPVFLAASDIEVIKLKTGTQRQRTVREVIEDRKASWTAWIIGVTARGYSVEQITMHMLENREPVIMYLPDAGPVITTSKIDPRTGKRVTVVVKPEFPPAGSVFDAKGIDGAERFVSDLAKDFDDLISGGGAVRPAGAADSSASGQEPSKNAGASRNGYPRYYKGKGTVTVKTKAPKYENAKTWKVSFEAELLPDGKAVIRIRYPKSGPNMKLLGRWTDKDTFSVSFNPNDNWIQGRYDEDSLRADYTHYTPNSGGGGYDTSRTFKFIINRVSRL